MSDDEKRGKLICSLRKKKKLTQKELGDLIHYTDKNVSKWERGISFPNNPNVLNQLAEILGVSIEELMYGELRSEENDEKIKANFLKQFKDNYNKYRKNINIIVFLFLIFVILGLLSIYMIFIKNSISVYSIDIYGTEVKKINATLVITNKINILSFNKIETYGKDISNINVYYTDKDGNKNVIISGENIDYYIEEKRGYEEYYLKNLVKQKLYLEIIYEGETTPKLVQLNVKEKYINDNIFPQKNKSDVTENSNDDNIDAELKKKLTEFGFVKKEFYYQKYLSDNVSVTLNVDTMNLVISIDSGRGTEQISSYFYDGNILYEYKENGLVTSTEIINVSDLKDCEKEKCSTKEDYAMY